MIMVLREDISATCCYFYLFLLFFIYADHESLIKRVDVCKNNSEYIIYNKINNLQQKQVKIFPAVFNIYDMDI